MTKQQLIEHWAVDIIPAVFLAEEALQKAEPQWKELLAHPTPDDVQEIASKYCHRIAEVIVTFGNKNKDFKD